MADRTPTELLGIKAILPAEWEDHTVYRFAAPEGLVEPIADPRMVASKKPAAKFRSNLVVGRHKLPADIPLEQIFDGPNRASGAGNPSYKQVAFGVGEYLGQPASWQDVAFFEPQANLQIFQRQIAVKPAPDAVVMLTLTSDVDQLDKLSAPLGFTRAA